MPLDVSAELDIAAERDAVAAYAMDPERDAEWVTGISVAELLDPPPLRVGSTVRRIASFLGRRIEYVLEVAELRPGSRIEMRSVRSPFPMNVTYAFADAPAGTRARIRVRGEPGGAYRLVGPLVPPMVRRSISKDLRNLKRIMEGSPP